MNISIVRHADSESGHSGDRSGLASCGGLTEEGHRQARRVAQVLALDARPNVLVSSPVRRARETCGYISDALELDVVEDCALCELHLGEADGMSEAEFAARFEPFDLLDQPDRPIAPGGESWNAFKDRVHTTMDGYAERCRDQTVLMVSHAGFIVMSVLALFDIPRPGTGAFLEPRHGALTCWRNDGTRWHLERYNAPAAGATGLPPSHGSADVDFPAEEG